MKKVKSEFSIKNLENISGIKAHTIRIWEKRYKLLSPERTNTNIRKYSLASLRKLLNINLLYKNGFKISKIANLEPEKIAPLVREIALENNTENISLNMKENISLNLIRKHFISTDQRQPLVSKPMFKHSTHAL